MRTSRVVVALALVGCSESNISSEPSLVLTPQPAPVGEPVVVVDVFRTFFVEPRADVLWVVDGSGSMYDDLQLLSDHWGSFMETIDASDTDYRVAVTGTNMGQPGVLMRSGGKAWIDRDTADPVNTFRTMASEAGTNGWSGYNFDATKACLQQGGDCLESTFRRIDHPLHTIVVTDEPDIGQVGTGDFVSWYEALMDEPEERTFSCILDPARTQAYAEASEQIGGTVVDVRGADWDQLLAEFAEQTRASAETEEFFLTRLPNPETIQVEMRPEEIAEGVIVPPAPEDTWDYDEARNSVKVDDLPLGQYTTTIRYEVRDGDEY